MPHSPQWYLAALAMILLLQDPAAVFAQDASEEEERMERVLVVRQKVTAQPAHGIPQDSLQRAGTVVVLAE